jgi:hypothetical protein
MTGYGRVNLPADWPNASVIGKPFSDRGLVEALKGLLPQVFA